MFRHKNRCLLLLPLLLGLSHPGLAKVKLPAIFGDHMVLQQKNGTSFWGWADPGETIEIRPGWTSTAVHTKTDASGKWAVTVQTPAAGTRAYTISIKGSNTITLKDVLIGEVWLCSGQSNMVFSLKSSENAAAEIARANFPAIRYFSVTRQYATHTFDDSPGAVWELASPATAPSFSAVAYYFAKKLHLTLNVPIGIVYSAWGGTPAEAWTPAPALKSDTVLSRYFTRWQDILKNADKDSLSHYYFERPWREPGVLFNGMIDPVIPFTLKGVLWYQGESNVNYADEYGRLLSTLISSWRQRWKKPGLPFYIVQISAYGYNSLENAAKVREAEYLITKDTPHTAMAVTLDLGNMKNIHYTRKKEVGDRLALIALAKDYGKSRLVYKGPEFRKAYAEDGKVIVTFEPSPAPLASPGKPVQGFELGYHTASGDSLIFVPADAKIIGHDKVLVWPRQPAGGSGVSPHKDPVAIRYGWLLPDQVNLFNTEGLPAFPFREKMTSQ